MDAESKYLFGEDLLREDGLHLAQGARLDSNLWKGENGHKTNKQKKTIMESLLGVKTTHRREFLFFLFPLHIS